MIAVEEHLRRCLDGVAPLAPRDVRVPESLGCLLTADVVSAVSMPPFISSSMDGYAVRAAELVGASDSEPIRLPVAGDVPAGPGEPLRLPPGAVIRVMTGAAIPEGADAIVPVEWTDGDTATVAIRQSPEVGAFVRPVGEDVTAGETVLRAGTLLSARHLGLAASVGCVTLPVRPRPRVVIVSTGSELVPAGEPLGFGQIYDSNGVALQAAVRELGADGVYQGFVGDDEDAVADALERATTDADLVITSGGVSAGAYDPVKAVLKRTGSFWFGPVAMQPGMPQGFGVLGDRRVPVLTLPGNPVSSMVSFEVFARPMIARLSGREDMARREVAAVAVQPWSSPRGKRQFARAVLTPGVAGQPPSVRPVGAQKSHLVADLAEANCLAVVPEGTADVVLNMVVTCLLLDDSLADQL